MKKYLIGFFILLFLVLGFNHTQANDSLPNLIPVLSDFPQLVKDVSYDINGEMKNIGNMDAISTSSSSSYPPLNGKYYFYYRFQKSTGPGGAGTVSNLHSYKNPYVENLNVNSSIPVQTNTSFGKAGTYSIRLCVDSRYDVDESNENDNCTSWKNVEVVEKAEELEISKCPVVSKPTCFSGQDLIPVNQDSCIVSYYCKSSNKILPDLAISRGIYIQNLEPEWINKIVSTNIDIFFKAQYTNKGTARVPGGYFRSYWQLAKGKNGANVINTFDKVYDNTGVGMAIGVYANSGVNYKFTESGDYSIKYCMDIESPNSIGPGMIEELDENNNCTSWFNFYIPKQDGSIINGGWTAWENQECDSYMRRQTRSCTNPSPSNGGNDCSQLDNDLGNTERYIYDSTCSKNKIDGGWTAWTPATSTCGTGTFTQTRTCTNPAPANGGANCTGSSTQQITKTPCIDIYTDFSNDKDDNTPSIKIISPNGGEIYKLGDKIKVIWNSVKIPDDSSIVVDIPELEIFNGGSDDEYIPNSKRDSGYYLIDEDTPEGKYKIKVSLTSDSSISDWSDNYFTITSKKINGNWSAWAPATSDCKTGTFTQTRTCTNPAPANGGVSCTGPSAQQVNCVNTNISSKFAPCGIYGDVNNNGYVDEDDIKIAKQGIDSIFVLTEDQIKRIDVNKDGVATASDLNYMSKYISGELNTFPVCSVSSVNRTLKLVSPRMRGEDVKILQQYLGITADGILGTGTYSKIIEWQKKNNLKPDGMFGPQSRTKAGL